MLCVEFACSGRCDLRQVGSGAFDLRLQLGTSLRSGQLRLRSTKARCAHMLVPAVAHRFEFAHGFVGFSAASSALAKSYAV